MSPGQTGHITGQMGRVPGQTGRTPGGVPPNFFYVYCFFFPHRSSSVNFSDFSQGNLENLVGNLEGIFRDISDPQNKGSKIWGKISEHFS